MLNMAHEMDYFKFISKAMARLEEEFDSSDSNTPGELAYLALTGKLESVIRDKLAYRLQKDDGLGKFVIRREWEKVDLAILSPNHSRGERAIVGVQFKAKSSSWKIIKEADKLRSDASDDLRKCKDKVKEAYTILIAPHFSSDPGAIFDKYKWTYVAVEAVNEAVVRAFDGWRIVGSNNEHKIEAGVAFKTRVSVLFWMCKPV